MSATERSTDGVRARLAAPRPSLVAAGATAIVMLLVLAGGGVWSKVGGQDLHGAFLPKYVEAARALFTEGRLPLWNPWELCGTPLYAVIQGLVLYLPAPLLFHLLPPYWALQALYAFNTLVLAWGTTLYLRAHGIGAWGALAAVLVTVNGVFTSYSHVGYDHPNFLASVAWIPWILLAWQRAVERGPRPWLGLAALGVAALWLAGYPDFPIDFSVLFGTVALVSGGATLVRRVGYAALAFVLGTALVAVQLLPLAEAVGQSFRAEAMSDYDSPRQLFAIFSSGLFRPYVLHRFGVAALALALLALWRPTRTTVAWAAALVVAICSGDPPLSWLYALPPFSSVRYALGWSHIAALFVGLLVAAALQSGLDARRRVFRLTVVALAVTAVAGSAWSIVRVPSVLRPVAPDYALLEQRVPRLKSAQDRLPGRPRVISGPELDAGMTVRARMASASGYDPTMPPRRVKRLIDEVNQEPGGIVRGMILERNPRLASLLGVGLVLVPRHFAPTLERHGFARVDDLPPNQVLLHAPPVPRARIVHHAELASDEESSFARTVDPARDLVRTAVIEDTAPLPSLVAPGAGAAEDASIVVDLPEQVEVDARLATPGLLVLTDTWYPGWSVTVDGVPASLLRADYAFRAVALAAGEHRVVFRYAPASLRWGFVATLATVLVVAALLVPRRTNAAPVA